MQKRIKEMLRSDRSQKKLHPVVINGDHMDFLRRVQKTVETPSNKVSLRRLVEVAIRHTYED